MATKQRLHFCLSFFTLTIFVFKGNGYENGDVTSTCRPQDIITRYIQCGQPFCPTYGNSCLDVQADKDICKGTVPVSCKGYQRAGNTNTYYTVIDSQTGTMAEGERKCYKTGGTLAMLQTLHMRSLVKQIVKDKMATFGKKPNRHGLWVGGHYDSSEGKFFWNDNTEIPLGSKLWHDNEPSTLTQGTFNTECILLYPALNYTLGDYQCDPESGPLLPLCQCRTN